MAATTNFSVRMNSEIKEQCEALYGELGINLTTAINVFLRQSLRAGGFPFDVRLERPNQETIAAMLEAERLARDPKGKLVKFLKVVAIAWQNMYNISAIAWKGVDNMAATTNFSVRMNSEIKEQCEALYGELGINLTTAINVFLRQSLRAGGFPFDVRLERPNQETIAAMLEAERLARDPAVKRYSNVEDALKVLKE